MTTRSKSSSARRRRWPAERTGALIVIERSIGLRNYIESGIPLDAQLTYDLLVSIFQPTSPLHDGAVIVQNDRVAAAACFLPLTVNPRLGRELGSRHRAAIGVTEENDAVAIVVSEETGVISLVLDGGIERELDPEQLRSRLAQLVLRRRGARPTRQGRLLAQLMALLPVSQHRPEVPVDLHCGAALAGRGRRSGGRARAAGADRVSEPAAGARDRRRSARGR